MLICLGQEAGEWLREMSLEELLVKLISSKSQLKSGKAQLVQTILMSKKFMGLGENIFLGQYSPTIQLDSTETRGGQNPGLSSPLYLDQLAWVGRDVVSQYFLRLGCIPFFADSLKNIMLSNQLSSTQEAPRVLHSLPSIKFRHFQPLISAPVPIQAHSENKPLNFISHASNPLHHNHFSFIYRPAHQTLSLNGFLRRWTPNLFLFVSSGSSHHQVSVLISEMTYWFDLALDPWHYLMFF